MQAAGLLPEDRELVDGVIAGQRRALAKAITLIESTRYDHQERAAAVLDALLPHTGRALRVGLTGVPGVGKSTFIEAFGLHLIAQGLKVAVLAIDPSSSRSGGSILGDKTRMERLSQQEAAFIRPSPSSGTLGGVAEKTREAMLTCAAAGFDVVIVETVGVGQSETVVAGMTDVFVLLQLPNAGDDLQAIKKGIMELADVVVYNKADLDATAAERACLQMRSALALLHASSPHWKPPVLRTSALHGTGIDAVWQTLLDFRVTMKTHGEFAEKRQRQALDWMWSLIDAGLRHRFREHPGVKATLPEISHAVAAGTATPTAAAHRLLNQMNRFF
jgi:LAO/AO transport system kinase